MTYVIKCNTFEDWSEYEGEDLSVALENRAIQIRNLIQAREKAIETIKPEMEVRARRVGGAAYQVPMQVNKNRQQSLAFRWILGAVREKKGRATAIKLADELMAAYRKNEMRLK